MTTIYKFELNGCVEVSVDVSKVFTILSVREQEDRAIVYIATDPKKIQRKLRLLARQTGDLCPNAQDWTFIGTAMTYNGTYVLHVFAFMKEE